MAPSNLSPFETNIATFPTHFALETTRNAPLPIILTMDSASFASSTITCLASLTDAHHIYFVRPPQSTDTILSQIVPDTFSTPILLMRKLRTPFIAADARKGTTPIRVNA